jgi:hypothetical protein
MRVCYKVLVLEAFEISISKGDQRLINTGIGERKISLVSKNIKLDPETPSKPPGPPDPVLHEEES